MSNERPTWRRRVRATAGWTAVGVTVAAGFFWLSGGYDSWRLDRALDEACDGDLAAAEVRALFPDTEFESHQDNGGARCRLRVADENEDGRAALTVGLRWASDIRYGLDAEPWSAPLGHGWTGSFAFDPDADADRHDQATAVVLLDCGGRSAERSGDRVIATVDARLAKGDFSDPAARKELTAVLTGTATSFAERAGCDVRPGQPVDDVGFSTTPWDHEPFAGADGTCAGVLDGPTARRWGVRTVIETAAGRAPSEACTLGGLDGSPLYELTADYGPFAADARFRRSTFDTSETSDTTGTGVSPDGHHWLEARCPGEEADALYAVSPVSSARDDVAPDVDHDGLPAALQRFAEASAKRHGCQKPQAS
ncbi:hypothetical protein GCM10010271_27410 [Streptomyces kurssanovii]|nr:hypothetical protein GCM10010271_27410 [Streptomyces kurssanovii]